MSSREKGLLSNIKLHEISLVDAPANKGAKVVLYKRDISKEELTPHQKEKLKLLMDEGKPRDQALAIVLNMSAKRSNDMNIEELQKKLKETEDALTKALSDLKSANDKASSDLDAVTKILDKSGVELKKLDDGSFSVTKAKEEEMIEFEGQMIAKSAVPAPILTSLEKQRKEIESLKKAASDTEVQKRATDQFPNLKGSAVSKGNLLRAVEGLEKKDADEVLESLKAADAAVAFMFKAVGTTEKTDLSSEETKLNKMVEDYQNEHKVSKAQAFSAVTESGEGARLLAEQRASKDARH